MTDTKTDDRYATDSGDQSDYRVAWDETKNMLHIVKVVKEVKESKYETNDSANTALSENTDKVAPFIIPYDYLGTRSVDTHDWNCTYVVDNYEGMGNCFKVIKSNWQHFDHKWKFGRNVLNGPFNPYECEDGGLYSTAYITEWLSIADRDDDCDTGVIAVCHIPYGAKVAWFPTKQKSDMLDIIDFYETPEEWAQVLIDDFTHWQWSNFASLKRQWKSVKLCLAAVQFDWRLLRHVPYDMRTQAVVCAAFCTMCQERRFRYDFNSDMFDEFQTRWYWRC
jgi:hypothetical protein